MAPRCVLCVHWVYLSVFWAVPKSRPMSGAVCICRMYVLKKQVWEEDSSRAVYYSVCVHLCAVSWCSVNNVSPPPDTLMCIQVKSVFQDLPLPLFLARCHRGLCISRLIFLFLSSVVSSSSLPLNNHTQPLGNTDHTQHTPLQRTLVEGTAQKRREVPGLEGRRG